ncbi:MAG: hypothetical protein OHK93_005449 [Ramalina farinacea]|uniref:AAA+ ATPase domain-containing protein n=1 Tax=Ramalina farinacea TaxID=258253 RepID=A0AA43QGQ6_9LECA|nr:hypothetical protein [Ramalina farinacea]
MVAFAIQKGLEISSIQRYISAFPKEIVKLAVAQNSVAHSHVGPWYPTLFFAVERKSPQLIRLLCEAGANPNFRSYPSGITLLCYIIISAEYELVDMTDCLVAALAMGADPEGIPRDMWVNYLQSPTRQAPKQRSSPTDEVLYQTEVRDALCRNLTLMQRYYLYKASIMGKPSPRMLQVASAFDFLPLFETYYHIIGQSQATEHVLRSLVSHYVYDADKPLVLALTGMSGHGKTELAKQMGDLLSLPLHRVDMTEMKHETDLFGPKIPYQGHQIGSQLNNFLAQQTGRRCVIFLDEFDKTTGNVRQSMLLLLESGLYQDRRTGKPLDCKRIIWIMAANLGDAMIQNWWDVNSEDDVIAAGQVLSYEELQRDLERLYTTTLGAPLTGRISAIIPFVPFDNGEQAVTTYKFLRELWHLVREPINVEAKKFARHTYLKFVDDGALATHLARKHYVPELGARSLEKAVQREVRARLAYKQMEGREAFTDRMNNLPLTCFEVRLVRSGKANDQTGNEVVEVVEKGSRRIIPQQPTVLVKKQSLEDEEL